MLDIERRRIQAGSGRVGVDHAAGSRGGPEDYAAKPKDLAFEQLDTCFFFMELSYDRPW